MKQVRSPKSILLMGYYGKGSFGDDLLCLSLAKHLARDGDYEIVIAAENPAFVEYAELENVRTVERNFLPILKALISVDILCQGGGTIFHDSYTGSRRNKYYLNLIMWAGLFLIGRLFGKTVLLVGAGVGPLTSPASKVLTQFALYLCSAISVRDQASAGEIKTLLTERQVYKGFDLACLDLNDETPHQTGQLQGPLVVAVSPCDLTPFSSGELADNDEYWRTLVESLNILSTKRPVLVKIFSMYTGGAAYNDDRIVEMMFSMMPEGACEIIKYNGHVKTILKEISSADVCVVARFHAAVSAYMAGRTFSVVAYNRKCRDFSQEVGLPQNRILSPSHIIPPSEWNEILMDLVTANIPPLLGRAEASSLTAQALNGALRHA